MQNPDEPPEPTEPFGRLLLRYLCPGALFRDANRGDRLEQAAALRFNQARRPFLLVFARRWAALAFFAIAAGVLFEQGAPAVVLSAAFFTVASCLFAGILWLLAAYAMLGSPQLAARHARDSARKH